jgi:putative intracellular protease/amidase
VAAFSRSNLALLQEAGARLVHFSPLTDPLPPDVSGIYFGGGYPERHALELSANRALRASVKAFAEAGGVIYAECGGLIYLSQSIQPLHELPATMGNNALAVGKQCHQQLGDVLCGGRVLAGMSSRYPNCKAWRGASQGTSYDGFSSLWIPAVPPKSPGNPP